MKKMYCVVQSSAITDMKAERSRQSMMGGYVMGMSQQQMPSFPDIWDMLARKLKAPEAFQIAGFETTQEAQDEVKRRMEGASVYQTTFVILETVLECRPIKTEGIVISAIE